ncbi:hypothetical protein [Streptomyces rubiginosohelvolus]
MARRASMSAGKLSKIETDKYDQPSRT